MAVTCMSVYALFLFVLAYLLNQLDRYILAVVNLPLSQELEYGSKGCLLNQSDVGELSQCNATAEKQCEDIVNINGSHICKWDYNGQGLQYQILAGPIFIVVYTFVGIPIGFAADKYNRKNFLGVAVFFWSAMTLLSGAVQEYWQLALLRFLLGVGEAGCTPFATSLIADLFDESSRALALGTYNLGIYIGYSMSYAFGNFITAANILGQGWRWAFYISGMPGLLLGPLICLTLREPQRVNTGTSREPAIDTEADDEDVDDDSSPLILHTPQTWREKAKVIAQTFCQPTLLMLCLAGSIRNAAGYVWAYYTQPYYKSLGQTAQDIGTYMSFIPLFAGSVGVVLGGFISDRVVKRIGPVARLLVLVASQVLAAPCVAGALYFDPPGAYYSLIPGYIVGEMWVGITLAVAVEVIPPQLRTTAIAVYLFIITNIGGNMVLLVTPLQQAFLNIGYDATDSLRAALYILYPGLYVLGAILFFFTLCLLRRDLRRIKTQWMGGIREPEHTTSIEEEIEGLKED